tara:strand:+ start:75 stop:377 length:303 start_codon:yes stop_codon:yes gene_type:complete
MTKKLHKILDKYYTSLISKITMGGININEYIKERFYDSTFKHLESKIQYHNPDKSSMEHFMKVIMKNCVILQNQKIKSSKDEIKLYYREKALNEILSTKE